MDENKNYIRYINEWGRETLIEVEEGDEIEIKEVNGMFEYKIIPNDPLKEIKKSISRLTINDRYYTARK